MKPCVKKLLSAVALCLAGISTANAGVLITEWSYDLRSWWTAFDPGSPDVTSTNLDGTHDDPAAISTSEHDRLSWGTPFTPSGQSRLTAVDPALGGTVFTNGAFVAAVSLTHDNFVITGTSLNTATLHATLDLFQVAPPGAGTAMLSNDFEIDFLETPNEAAICADGTPNPGAPGCYDIFVLADPGDLSQDFVHDGYIYTVTIVGAGFGPLSDEACTSVGVATGCFGFETPEDESTTVPFFFDVTARPVPEPETLALLGLGLLGLGLRRRRMA